MLSDLKACQDRKGLAILLGVSPKEFAYTLFHIPGDQKYESFCVSKKNGGTRNILAPVPRLKWLQRRLLEILYQCAEDISVSAGESPNLHFGFRPQFNIYENAFVHRRRRFVLNLDIVDYFDQFNFGRVQGFFLKDKNFELVPAVATAIAQIACFDNKLPQGSPCSPHIANLVSQFFDNRMARFLRSRRCSYSRYADDITISTNLRVFPSDVAEASDSPQGWQISPILTDIFQRSGFAINDTKVRMGVFHSRQTVTGLTVNKHPNISRDFYLNSRAMCNSLIKSGSFIVQDISGSFGNSCNPDLPPPIKSPLMVLEGRLSHIHNIKEKNDGRDLKYKQASPTQFWKLLRKFYQYKYFVINDYPLIITEGPSDIFYLKSAIRNTKLLVPNLYADEKGGRRILPQFFNLSNLPSKVLALNGGAGNIKKFIHQYSIEMRNFFTLNRTNPVVMVVDNDSGGEDVFGQIKKSFGLSVKTSDKDCMVKVSDYLYLIKTPHIGPQDKTSVEDMLPSAVRGVALNGKTFSTASKFDTSKHFGKVALASYVHANSGSVDFSGFDPLLLALDRAIADSKS
ncbi:retron Ec67 family RNA-directed DNA polymerase/endonuclease [Sphingomonas sp. LM7]|uniref:retron Ec67 family RNA-directed DNA polymerase/endonuclease n=1 Tax=Sphingomonas sp. LM7 TaxID=1938607 RepID=UPI00098404C6|nr:retron Ec67 family RNA-directed DNA polymerase/endonuclease [Sphingomonas sp. LM7]AQR73916.1 hypothetical protein BXU08_09880 [Sphingomonas sp. LM7]